MKLIKAHERDRENQQKDLLISMKSPVVKIGHVHYRDGRDSRFADAGGIAERVAFCRYN
jgi:hypothetical protein